MTLVPDARFFDGHFDGTPILPGVAQIALALAAYADDGMPRGHLTGLRDVRFACRLGPDDPIDIRLAPGREPDTITFEIRSGDRVATRGLLIFAVAPSLPAQQ